MADSLLMATETSHSLSAQICFASPCSSDMTTTHAMLRSVDARDSLHHNRIRKSACERVSLLESTFKRGIECDYLVKQKEKTRSKDMRDKRSCP